MTAAPPIEKLLTKGEQIALGYFGTWEPEMKKGFRRSLAREIDQALAEAKVDASTVDSRHSSPAKYNEKAAEDIFPTKCTACGGNDGQMPCLYPRQDEQQPGCLRAKRLKLSEIRDTISGDCAGDLGAEDALDRKDREGFGSSFPLISLETPSATQPVPVMSAPVSLGKFAISLCVWRNGIKQNRSPMVIWGELGQAARHGYIDQAKEALEAHGVPYVD